MHRNGNAGSEQRRRFRNQTQKCDALSFFNVLTAPALFDELEAHLPAHRERLFPPTETLSMYLAQALSADRSCQKALDEAAVKRLVSGVRPCSTHTGGYCRARQRLPVEMVSALSGYTGRWISAHACASWQWRGRPVRLVDGTTLTLADTAANQHAYPQARSQKPGLGSPICRMVALICLGSGAVLDAAVGQYHGKGADEQSLLRSMLGGLARGDVLLGDALYATYFLLGWLHHSGIEAVFEQHGARARSTDFRCGQRLGARDHLIVLDKPKTKPRWMSAAQYEQAPDTLTVRELRTGGKTLVTTLLCPEQTSKADLRALYRSRWHVELDLRNLKTTLGMHRLSCRTPAMAIKELWVYLLAHNLIRMMMAQAALRAGCVPRHISFKHTVQLWIAWAQHAPENSACFDALLVLIAQKRVGNRPGRVEPRAIKQRPNAYPLMTEARCTARAHIRKHGHPKKVK
jgi:hypothetical protein